ncbi:uncharacterized protein LOC134816921 [Bolinopsis microptera]|uniref:uncharacterized protein LOC134816921 n=1 Tax=Bolinopsis microptera TaxID=2820187 RepID=UPI00307943E5
MPYVTEQLRFNLERANAAINNKAAIRQPSPMLFNGIENHHDNNNTMERAMLLAKRDIRLGNLFKDDDLDHIPVKEVKIKSPEKLVSNNNLSQHKHGYVKAPARTSFSPGRPYVSHSPNRNPVESRKASVWRPNKSASFRVNIPSAAPDSTANKSIKSISMMIDNIEHAYIDLGKPVSKQGYPDPIVELRLQRRVEEQRRHLCRLLYNTKRHVSELVGQLKRTAFIHRGIVLTQSNVFSHMSTAYRSLMSALNSFIRVSRTLQSTYMTDLVKKVRGDLKLLLQELRTICELQDVQISTLISPAPSPSQVVSTNSVIGPAGKLNLADKVKQATGSPLSPDRNESLKAALKSLIVNNMSKMNISAKEKSRPPKNLVINKKAPSTKPSNSKVIKPKSKGNVSRYNNTYKRAMSAGVKRGKRPLGKPLHEPLRPTSAPNKAKWDPLEIRGNVTPLITEREVARQAWIDELGRGNCPASPELTLSTGELSHAEEKFDEIKAVIPSPISIPCAEPSFKTKELSTTMTQLLGQLEEIQKEDDDIRSRWLHMQYSNPLNMTEEVPLVCLPSAELIPTSIIATPPAIHSQCTKTGLALLNFPKQNMRQIESYKNAMLQYLRLTKHFKTSGFDPWATINNIVDNIADNLVDDVCNEIINSCDGIADNIYLSEFLPA